MCRERALQPNVQVCEAATQPALRSAHAPCQQAGGKLYDGASPLKLSLRDQLQPARSRRS
jgi:hypothetical protein